MQPKFRRLIIGATALAVAAGGLLVTNNPAQALPPGTAPNGTVTIPATQLLTATLAMAPNPAPAICNGNGVAGYRWHAFISDSRNDPATITYTGAGAVAPLGFTSSLLSTTGSFVTNLNPSSTGQITPIPGLNLSLLGAALVPGTYNIGFACSLAGETTNYWSSPVTISATNISFGAVPTAPNLEAGGTTSVAVTATTAVVDFTQAAAVPAVTGFTATVSPSAGVTIAPLTAASTSISLSGLTTGTPYTVSLVSTNPTGNSPSSNSVTFTPSAAPQPAINFTATPGTGSSTVSFTAPVAGVGGFTAVPTSYTLTVAPAPAAPGQASYTIPAAVGPISQLVEGLTPGTAYTATLQPTYAAPDAGPPVSRPLVGNSAQIIQQRITVTRPVGQLILTQRCGVNGAIPAFTGTATVPGFPTSLPAIPATTDQIGTSPDTTPAAPGLPANPVDIDSEFGVYPFPSSPVYPTECGITLGTSSIVTTGAGAGLYFQADGSINEVTVSDTRDTNAGWTLNGRMNDFIGLNTPTNTFDGDWMGWVPQLQNSTAGQTITTGGTVLPGTGVLPATPPGLGSGALLGSAAAGAGLGVTQFDARLLLLIPTSTPTDDYIGLLDFTVA